MNSSNSNRDVGACLVPDEERPLLGGNGKAADKSRAWRRLRDHHTADVSKHRTDVILLFCYLITGLLDSSATHIWGSFVSMQTGNTVYLGLGLAAPKSDTRWIQALVSVSSFCLGSFFFSRFHRYFSPRRRWVLVASYCIQLVFVTGAAVMVTVGENMTSGLQWQVLVPLAAVAFQSSGQAVTSRILEHNNYTSVVLTSTYCDLFSDPDLLGLRNVERNRRAAAVLLLLLGAIGGGFWAHSEVGMQGALWTAVVLKALIIVAWGVWRADDEEEEQD